MALNAEIKVFFAYFHLYDRRKLYINVLVIVYIYKKKQLFL